MAAVLITPTVRLLHFIQIALRNLLCKALTLLWGAKAGTAPTRPPVVREGHRIGCLLIDGCNLPFSLRREEGCSRPQLVSRTAGVSEDWTMLLASVVGEAHQPFARARVLFDGDSASGRRLASSVEVLAPGVDACSTSQGRSADDALVAMVAERAQGESAHDRPTTVEAAREALSRESAGSEWFVVRRVGGGERSHARLWRRLGLVRSEGAPVIPPRSLSRPLALLAARALSSAACLSAHAALHTACASAPAPAPAACFCLLPLTAELRAQACADARRLCDGASRFVSADAREREPLRTVVGTDDVLLARRVVDAGGASLTWRQLRALCSLEPSDVARS
jgi:hypothetical protein